MAKKSRRHMEINMDTGKKLVLVGHLVVVFLLLFFALWPTCWFVMALQPHAHSALAWTLVVLGAVIVFNYAYLLALIGLRVLVPYPKEGFYPRAKDGRLPREAVAFMLNVLLNKSRIHTPWAGMFSSVFVALPPLDWLYRRFFGPNTSSVSLGDTAIILDPYLVTAGQNVQFGFRCILVCHLFDHRGLLIKGIEIGDHVTLGGECVISPGVRIGDHAVIAGRSVVGPGAIIGPYEFWAGSPAQKVKDLRRPSEAAAQPNEVDSFTEIPPQMAAEATQIGAASSVPVASE